jgi:hypothetical protein
MSAVKRSIVKELYKQSRVNFPRRHVVIKGLNDLYQADLIEMQDFSNINKKYRYILLVINTFSKMIYGEPLKDKTGKEVAAALETILKKVSPFKLLQTDNGTDFYNKHVRELLIKYNIHHYSTYSTKKASIIERSIRTIKTWLYKELAVQGNYKWLELLPKVIEKYNNTIHTTTEHKPISVSQNNERTVLKNIIKSRKKLQSLEPKYQEGDHVRISKYRHIFKKGYLPNFTTEIFKIIKVQNTQPPTYLLNDLSHSPIMGSFYEHELQKTYLINDYLVEKVIRKSGEKMFVKWLGFGDEHNSWINITDII